MAKKLTVVQTGSPIRRTKDQRATLVGLGLNRIGRRSDGASAQVSADAVVADAEG